MKSILTIFLVLTTFFSFSQDIDYIINLDGEKVPCEIFSNSYKKVKALLKGEEVKYEPDDIKGFIKDGITYESGKVAYGSYGVKIWAFLTVVEDGNMLLCKIESTYYQKDNMRSTETMTVKTPLNVVVHYARLAESKNDDYIKIGIKWKKDLAGLGMKCSDFVSKVKKVKHAYWDDEETLKSLITFFNTECE